MFNNFIKSLLFFCLIILTFLVPNSFTEFSFCIQIGLSICIILSKNFRVYKTLFYFWSLISIFFLFYIAISPIQLSQQFNIFLRYVVSPFTWLIIFHYIKFKYDFITIQKYLIFFSLISCSSVLIFYFLFYNGHGDFLNILIDNPNIDNLTGLGFRLHVYGVLIFFAFAITPTILNINGYMAKTGYFIIFASATILSGRTALLLNLFLGLLIFLFFLEKLKYLKFNAIVYIIIILFVFHYFLLFENNGIEFSDYLITEHIQKIEEAGGEDRSIQLNQIFQKFLNFPFGIGFISLQIIRNDINTWQYETLIPALLMRFGIFTIGIILFSIFFITKRVSFNFSNQIGHYRLLLILGFFGILIASFTNPYLESPSFQWMFIGPIVLLYKT